MDDLMQKVLSLDYSEEDLKEKSEKSIYVRECPYCQRHWKLNINASKGVFRCPACGESGNAVSLHAKLHNLTIEESKQELVGVTFNKENKPVKPAKKELPVADLATRDKIYREIILKGMNVSLSIPCANDLARRGLPLNKMPYIVATQNQNCCCTSWFQDLKGRNFTKGNAIVKGVPGVFGVDMVKDGKEDYKWTYLNMPRNFGYLIPIITHLKDKPAISCCQIRHLEGEVRYTFFTSQDLANGVSVTGCNKVHYSRNFFKKGTISVPKTVYLTEGPLKADVASYLSGRCFIAVPGVNSVSDLPKELRYLKSKGCEKINLAFDMDYREKKEVKKAMDNVSEMIKKSGLKLQIMKWDNKYKGIDDYLLSKKSIGKGEKKNGL